MINKDYQEIHDKEIHDKEEMFIKIKALIISDHFEVAENLIRTAIMTFPHAPEPHNLFGILLEKMDEHSMAMKHFRIALELDPMYLPARHNLECYGTFFSKGNCAYDETDCVNEVSDDDDYKVNYDKRGIGHIIRRE